MGGYRNVAIIVAAAAGISAAQAQDEEALAIGDALSEAFNAGHVQEIWSRITDKMRDELQSPEALSALRSSIRQQFGPEKTVLSRTVEPHMEYRIYLRTAEHARGPAPLLLQWTLDEQDRVAGFFVRPQTQAAQSRFLDYQTKADLRLPFEGEWHVFWGGRTLEGNYHAANAAQRFAYDFIAVRNGKSSSGSGERLEDYYCWDKPILAPADGVVERVVDGLPDNPIGKMDAAHPAGNHVVLDLGDGEFAFLAHLKRGSVAVGEGERVETGDEIGRCGNSGNSSEPHLHFHLQTTPELTSGEGLPAFFQNYAANGKPVAEGEPKRGQTVSPLPD